MTIRAIEARLERMSVNDENEPANGGPVYQKPKVILLDVACEMNVAEVLSRALCQRQCRSQVLALIHS